jgi:tetratricopeptide (TPR) repeat protein
VDDFPLADDASLAVLHLLMRRLADRPFMVVLTSRPELQQDAPNAQRIRNGVGYLGMQVLDLEPMHRQDMEALLDLLIREGHPRPGPSERRILLRAAAGYPLALELLFQDWLTRGATSVGFSLDAMTPEVVERPDRFYEVVADGLIQSLDSATRMTLHLAAVLDRRLNDLELYRLVDQTPAQTMVCLARLVDIRALRDRGAGLEFINPGMRTQAYLGIPTPLRRMLHAGVADRLLELEARGQKIPGLEIAWHSIRSGRMEQVGPYLVRGAREAIDDGAPHEAELALVSGMNLLHDALREQGHLLLAEALQELGRWQDSARHLTSVPRPRAADLALKTELLVIRAQVRTAELGDTEVLKIAGDMEALARTHDVPSLRVLAIEIAAYACDHLRHLDLSRTLREAADTIPLEPLEPGDKLRLLLSKARLAYFERENSSAEAFLKQAERVAEGAGMRSSLLAQTIAGYGVISVAKGDYASAIPHFSRQFEMARRLDDDFLAARTAANLALCWSRLGDLERQYEWASRCLGFKPSRTYNVDQVLGLGLLGLAQGMMGQRVEARRTARELATRSLSHHPLWLGQTVVLNAADIYWIAGERERALALATRGTTADYSIPRSREIAGSFARWCAVAAVTRGRPLPSDHLTTMLQLLAARERIDAGEPPR